jgi:hypothetical protein
MCPECGMLRPEGRAETTCVPCANQGHLYRLVSVEELLWMAARDESLGYEEKAADRRRLTASPVPVRVSNSKPKGTA